MLIRFHRFFFFQISGYFFFSERRVVLTQLCVTVIKVPSPRSDIKFARTICLHLMRAVLVVWHRNLTERKGPAIMHGVWCGNPAVSPKRHSIETVLYWFNIQFIS